MNITNFESLIAAARQQAEPQRLLFVFLAASSPKDHGVEAINRFHAGQGGELQAIMCVDKTLEELGSFTDLVEESKKMEKDWKLVLVAALSGKNGVAPSSAETEQPLKMMVQTVESGGDLSQFMAFDKDGTPVQFG
jgi:hypothetical protein